MPSNTSGRIVKSRKGTYSTPHQKNHRWESFTTKISKLHSLDPLRKVRRHDLEAEDLDTTTSYLRNGLDKWADLNISKAYMNFKREVRPFCDSLPQILHAQDKIMEILARYIEAHDKEAMEPLLDLLTAFAHDLGTRFEKHYPTALNLVINIASRPQDAAVVEWTFACLAFLFKYLAKLLVPDLRPTYDALAPLLGRSRNPPHIVRFAAEALSFLVKKAAAPAHREKALPLIVEHARQDLEANRQSRQGGLYYHGLMTVFAEAIKGQGRGIHTTGAETFKALLVAVPSSDCITDDPNTWADLVCGVLTSAVHHTTVDTFDPITQSIVETAAEDEACASQPLRNCLYVRLLGTMSGVRKGDRVSAWAPTLQCLQKALVSLSKKRDALDDVPPGLVWQHLIINIAIVWFQAPMDAVIPCLNDFSNVMTREPLLRWFISFCSYYSDLDTTRFRSLFLKPFQKFVVMHWSEPPNEEVLCVTIPRMVRSGALPSPRDGDGFALPQSWQDQIVTKFERLEISPFPEEGASSAYNKDPKTWHDKCLPKYAALLDILESTTVRPSTNGPIAEILLRKLKLALRPSPTHATTEEARFIASQGFATYLRIGKTTGQIDTSLGPLLRAAAPQYSRLTGFLEAMIAYEDRIHGLQSPAAHSDSSGSQCEENPFLTSLVENLSSPSHEHRSVSLKLLAKLDAAPDHLESLATMIQAEDTPLDLANVRAVTMYIRKLAMNYSQLPSDSWLLSAIPAFLFGMLTVRMSPVWDAAVEALSKIGESKTGEEVVSELTFKWTEHPSKRWDGPPKEATAPTHTGLTDFECLNYAKLKNSAQSIEETHNSAPDILLKAFEDRQVMVSPLPPTARTQALKVFLAAPHLAEKRSRRLVPLFLPWALESADPEGTEDSDQASRLWSLFDKKSFIGVFAQFSNPKVLYQSAQVYHALLNLLANGDAEVQKPALKAILTWKQEGVRPYQEHLEYLLDDARFKNELTVLFQGDNQVQPEHRAEMMPVLLRLLYGRTISKKGVASGRGGQQATRLAVLRHLSVEDLGAFLDISLGALRDVRVVDNSRMREDIFDHEIISVRKMAGFMKMMEALIGELGENVMPYVEKILQAVLYGLVSSSRKLRATPEPEDEDGEAEQLSLYRVVRNSSLKCLVALLQQASSFEWTPYKEVLVKEALGPRIEALPTENTQGISGILQLLSTLASIPKTAIFFSLDERIVPKLAQCLTITKSKEEVKIFALGVIRSLVRLSKQPAEESEFNELIEEELLKPNINSILEGIMSVLKTQGDVGRNLLGSCVEAVVELCPIVLETGHATDLLDISDYLLNQPSRRANPKIKSTVLSIVENMLIVGVKDISTGLRDRIHSTVSSLFGYFKDRSSREALPRILTVLPGDSSNKVEVAELCAQLNTYNDRRIEEPDFDARLAAFNKIATPRDTPFSPQDWEPLLHNFVFYIKYDEEYGVLSSNSADGLCQFIKSVAASPSAEKQSYYDILEKIVMPAIHANVREPSETVRRETMRVLGGLVSELPTWGPVSDLVELSPEPDENESDPSFFNNILSPSTARQFKALQTLTKVNYHKELGSRNLAHLLIPLLEHFIFGRSEGSDDHGVGAEAGTTIAELAVSLEWPQYRAILRRYISYIEQKPDLQKQIVRLLGKFADALSNAAVEKATDAMDVDNVPEQAKKAHRLSLTMPAQDKFTEDILGNILPPLMDYLHEKDETTVSSRVPIGVIIVKILKLVPEESLGHKLPGVLTDICHILRSKAWDSREMARDTLAKISLILGPSCLGFVLTELRGALTKGYQMHVLSYTMHTILVTVIPSFQPGDIDYCLGDIVAIIMDDIFGATGQEKDAEEYISKMKEVKSSKSQDSMELIARTSSVEHLVDLISPLQALLLERLDLRMVRKIDDLLSRISNGLLGNAAVESRDTLVLCYEVIQKAYESDKPQVEAPIDPKLKRYLVQKGAKKSGDRNASMTKHTYKLVRFAIDVLRAVWKKHESLRNSANITGFIPILGDAIVGGEEEVRIATYKLLNVLVKVPFKTDDFTKLYNVAAKDAIKNISMSVSTNTDVAQTALKLISIILRDRRDVTIKDSAVDMLLGKLKDDLTEPLYRHVTFNFLRSVLDRKVETAVVYDTLDYVGTVMITNDDKNTRDLARGAFFQFLRDYPQKKNRWAKQLSFVVANLKYEREGGRLSAMEVIHLLLMKTAEDFVQDVVADCFIPVVFVLANDDSDKCKLAAAELIKEIFRKADKERATKFLALVRNWVQETDNSPVLQLGIQSIGLYFESKEPTSKDRKDVELFLKSLIELLSNFSAHAGEPELINTALQTALVVVHKYPSLLLSNADVWRLVPEPLSSTDPSVRLSGVQLLSAFLADFYQNDKNQDSTAPLSGSHGLQLDATMVERLVMNAVSILNPGIISRWKKRMAKKGLAFAEADQPQPGGAETPELDESLVTEVSRIIVMLARFLKAGPPAEDAEADDAENDAAEDDEDEWGGIDEQPGKPAAEGTVTLDVLLRWLSDVMVEETPPRAAALVPKLAALDVVALLVGLLPAAGSLEPSLGALLAPLAHLTDPSIPAPYSADGAFGARHESLKGKAVEAMEALQAKVGTAAYTARLLRVREAARRRREGRSRKRRIEAVSQPERFGQWKKGRLDKKVKRRKEKGEEQRARRVMGRYG